MLAKVKLPDTLSAEEAAAMIGVHKSTLIDYIKAGLLEAYRVSPTGPYRVYRDSIEKYIREIQRRKN